MFPTPNKNHAQRIILQQQLTALRRHVCRNSFPLFCQKYLPKHFRLPASTMHEELFGLLAEATETRNTRLAIAAPRGHAKSTVVTLAYTLWCICYGLEPYIVIASDTTDQATERLTEIKEELESNPLFIRDFPEIAYPPDSKPRPSEWSKKEIVTRNNITVTALGAGQKIRGRKRDSNRPTLIILDDVENEKSTESANQRENKMIWFSKSVLKAGTTGLTNVIVVGTILHYDSLLAELIDGKSKPGWTARKYQAVRSWAEHDDLWQQWQAIYTHHDEHEGQSGKDAAKSYFQANREAMLEGTSVLWPQRENYYDLMEMRLCEGQASFDSEKQNEPIDPESCLFKMDSARYWDDEYSNIDDLLAKLGGESDIYGACDPSLGKAGRNRDDTAIVVVLHHRPTGHLYVLDASISRRTPSDTIKAIIEYHRIRKFKHFAIETNQFQDFLASEVERMSAQMCVRVSVKKISHTHDKFGRIQSLESMVSSEVLHFCRKHRKLIQQLRLFPKAAHDDGPDALEMAVALTRKQGATMKRYSLYTGKEITDDPFWD